MVDVTKTPFPDLMDGLVLKPAGMRLSTFAQPLPHDREGEAGTGHYADGKELRGGYHVFPEHAAAGLWSTPSDLANLFAPDRPRLARREPPLSSARDGAPDTDAAEWRLLWARRRHRRCRCALSS
jgi:CubicO group peptidase (beta-lactamase class C family)